MDRAERSSPLTWLAQLSAMLADDPNTPAARAAAFRAIASFPGLIKLGAAVDPQGRPGIAFAERAGTLHPLLIATGKGCHNPNGGAGCVGVGSPTGRYQLEMIFDPSTDTVLAVRTIALNSIPTAKIPAGTPVYVASYLTGEVVFHPPIAPIPVRPRPTVQSVPWRLIRASARRITVRYESGTCDPTLAPRPRVALRQASNSITLTVLLHVVKDGGGMICAGAGVGLAGRASATLNRPIGSRRLLHGKVTDHEK